MAIQIKKGLWDEPMRKVNEKLVVMVLSLVDMSYDVNINLSGHSRLYSCVKIDKKSKNRPKNRVNRSSCNSRSLMPNQIAQTE